MSVESTLATRFVLVFFFFLLDFLGESVLAIFVFFPVGVGFCWKLAKAISDKHRQIQIGNKKTFNSLVMGMFTE
jgi:hypothetical protein